jgi:hypothetical protein
MQLNVRSSVTTLDTGTRGGRGSGSAILIALLGFREPQICLPKEDHLTDLYHVTTPFQAWLPLFGAVLSEQDLQRALRTPTP